jgi:hypothetical protein
VNDACKFSDQNLEEKFSEEDDPQRAPTQNTIANYFNAMGMMPETFHFNTWKKFEENIRGG